MSKLPTFTEHLHEDLRNWFGKGKEGGVGGGGWDRYNTKGERIGKCGDAEDRGGEGEGKPKCLSTQKAAQLRAQGGKQAIANAVKRKKADDPVTDRPGTGNAPKMVSNRIEEENEPTNPSLWARAKAAAKQKFDVYPSAYANGWAAKWYKERGGGWRTKKNEAYDDNVQTSTPADREWGTDSLVRIYKQMTPGQTDEAWERNPNCQQCRTKLSPAELKRGDRVCGKCVKHNKGRVWGKDSDDDYEEQMDLVPMRSVNEHIVKVKDGYRLVSKKTDKNLGTYPTKAGAEKRERQVQYFKHHEEVVMTEALDIHSVDKLCRRFNAVLDAAREREIDHDLARGRTFDWARNMSKSEVKDRLMSMNNPALTPKVRQKFIALDLVEPSPSRSGSGAFLVNRETGEIGGIRGYGQLHPSYRFGTVDAPRIADMVRHVRPWLTPFVHEATSMRIPSFKEYLSEQPETVLVKPAMPGELVSEVTPPGMEDWVKKNKARFRKQYGNRGDEVLYATAWDMYEKGKRESVNEEYSETDDSDMVMAQLSSIIERATALRSMVMPGDLPAWVQSKMTEADSCILAVHDYLKFKE